MFLDSTSLFIFDIQEQTIFRGQNYELHIIIPNAIEVRVCL